MRLAALIAILFTLTSSYAKTLNVGIVEYYPPFVLSTGNNHSATLGFDVDLIEEICNRISIQCQLKPMLFRELLPSLDEGNIDLAIGGITITHQIEKNYLFSLPYLLSYAQFAAPNRYRFHSIADIPGHTVGTVNGSIYATMLAQQFGDAITVKLYDKIEDMFIALARGSIEILIFNRVSIEYWYANSNGALGIIGEPIRLGLGFGIASTENNADLIEQVNQALTSIEADGTYLRIYYTYFGENNLTATNH